MDTFDPNQLPVFGGSGSGHGRGAVPDPGASAGSTRFLREDATWATPAGGGGGGGGVVGAEIRMGANGFGLTTTSALIAPAGQAPFQITLPSSGTYLVQCTLDITAGTTANDLYTAQFYNITAAAVVANTAQINNSIPASDTGQIILSAYVTVSGATAIGVYVSNGTAARGMVPPLSSHLWYTQLTTSSSAYNPMLGSFSPNYGLAGTSVAIVGSGFTGATAIVINGTAATSFTVNSDTSITATVPTETAGTNGVISVTTAGGTAASVSAYFYQSNTPTGIRAYVLGGLTGSTTSTNLTDKITFSTTTTAAQASANLSSSRFNPNGVAQQNTKGYACGGNPTYGSPSATVATTDKTTFSSDTTAAVSSANLSVATQAPGGVSQGSANGFEAGGKNTSGTDIVTANTITYSTDTTVDTSSANLSVASEQLTGISAGQTNGKGYFLGGSSSGTDIVNGNKITFSTSTTVAQSSANLSVAKYGAGGLSDGALAGYASGGYTTSYVATTDKITFSNDTTAAASSSNLVAGRNTPAPVSSGSTYAFAMGGAGATNTTETDQLTFSTATYAAVSSANLSTGKSSAAGYGDQGF